MNVKNKKVSVLVPAYNEGESIPLLYKELCKLMQELFQYEWDILFVNDGSNKHTLDVIKELREKDKVVTYLDLSRNFGKENAMLTGFDYVTGDCMVIIDAHLQHPPFVIKNMLEKCEEGFDDVYAKRISRGKESLLRKEISLFFYEILQKISDIDILPIVGGFRLLDRRCINALRYLRESERYTKGMYCWIGFSKNYVTFEQGDRINGNSTWNFLKLLKLGMNGVVSFTTVPLRIATFIGVLISILAILYMCFFICKTVIYGEPVVGYPTLIITILLKGSIQLLCLGILGEYVARIFNQSKNRPVCLVHEFNGIYQYNDEV